MFGFNLLIVGILTKVLQILACNCMMYDVKTTDVLFYLERFRYICLHIHGDLYLLKEGHPVHIPAHALHHVQGIVLLCHATSFHHHVCQ